MILFVNCEPRLLQDPGETGYGHRLSDDDRDFLAKWMAYRLAQQAPAALNDLVVVPGDRIRFTYEFRFEPREPLSAEDIKWRP